MQVRECDNSLWHLSNSLHLARLLVFCEVSVFDRVEVSVFDRVLFGPVRPRNNK